MHACMDGRTDGRMYVCVYIYIHTHMCVLHAFAVLPRQGLGSLTAGLDALDLVAVHDQLVLLADLHVVLEATVHRVIPGQV